MIGSKSLVFNAQKQIDIFVKSDLHLKIKQSKVMNRNENYVKFLGFQIYFATFCKKTKVKGNKFASIAKYRRRVLARINKSDARLAKAAVFEFKKNLVKAFRVNLSKHGKLFNRSNIWEISNIFAHQLLPKKDNIAMMRWERHFEELFDKELSLSLKFYHIQLSNLAIPMEEPLYSQVLKLRDKFLEGLKEIQSKKQLKFLENRKKRDADTISKKKWHAVSEETAIKTTGVLKKAFLNQSSVRQICIAAPLLELLNQFIVKGFYHYNHRKPIANISLMNLNDGEIVYCYSQIMNKLINYYRPVDNLIRVKGFIEGLRKSCCLTLALKHKKPLVWVYTTYSENVVVVLPTGMITSLPNLNYIANLKSKFFVSKDCSFNLDDIMKNYRFHANFGD
jgi:hypothetical protein